MLRLLPVLLLLFTVTACTVDDPVDDNLLSRLKGSWVQQDGNASLTIYQDTGLKLTMPDEHPPLRLLTSVENNKDHGIAFSVGDRWAGPVYIVLAKDGDSLELHFPPDDPGKGNGRVMTFRRAD